MSLYNPIMKIRRNIFLFKLYFLLGDLWPLSALAIVYFQQISGSYALAMGVFSVANLVQSISEIPTGVMSDRLGRRRTMIMSSSLYLASFVMFALAGNLGLNVLLLIGGVVWGLAGAFASGTDDAFMYETMQQLRKEDKYDIVYARSKAFGQIGLGVGALIAALVTYFYSLNTLAWISAVLGLGGVIISVLFVEPDVRFREESTSYRHFIAALKEFVKNKKLQILSLIQMLNRGISFTSHRLEGAYFNMLIPTWLVNVTRMMKQACGTVSFFIAPYVRKFGFYKLLVTSTLGMTVIKATSVVLNNFATPFIQSCVNIFYGVSSTAESALLQKELSSKQRATMGSIVSLMGGILSAVIYWIVGIIADISSVYFAIILLIACNLITTSGYYWMFKKYKNR